MNHRRWPASVRPAGTGSKRPRRRSRAIDRWPTFGTLTTRRASGAARRRPRASAATGSSRCSRTSAKTMRVEPLARALELGQDPGEIALQDPIAPRRASDASRGSFSIPVTSQAGFRAAAAMPAPAPQPTSRIREAPDGRRRVSSGRSCCEGSLRATRPGRPDRSRAGRKGLRVTFECIVQDGFIASSRGKSAGAEADRERGRAIAFAPPAAAPAAPPRARAACARPEGRAGRPLERAGIRPAAGSSAAHPARTRAAPPTDRRPRTRRRPRRSPRPRRSIRRPTRTARPAPDAPSASAAAAKRDPRSAGASERNARARVKTRSRPAAPAPRPRRPSLPTASRRGAATSSPTTYSDETTEKPGFRIRTSWTCSAFSSPR